jgi:hypothetical protein
VADEMLEVLRAARIAQEARVRAEIVGAATSTSASKEIAADGVPLVVPVTSPIRPTCPIPDDALDVTVEELRHWQNAPRTRDAAKAGVTFALTANGLKDVKSSAPTWRSRSRAAGRIRRARGGHHHARRAARLSDRLGTLAPARSRTSPSRTAICSPSGQGARGVGRRESLRGRSSATTGHEGHVELGWGHAAHRWW